MWIYLLQIGEDKAADVVLTAHLGCNSKLC